MARNKSNLKINLEYAFSKGIFSILSRLPSQFASKLSIAFLKTLLLFLPRRRAVMEKNIAQCFPTMPLAERQRISRTSIELIARGIAYYPRLATLTDAELKSFATIDGADHVYDALKRGKGVILFTAHYGFWELLALYVAYLFPNVSMIGRPLDNPKIDAWVTAIRQSQGGTVIAHRQALKKSLKALNENGVLGILMDQNLYKGGLFVDFFDRPAATTSIISILARRTGCAVIPILNRWEGDRLRVTIEPELRLSPHPVPEQAIAEDTQQLATIMERWIRQDPTQWLWLHNRWKRHPEPGDTVYSKGVLKIC